MLKPFLVTAFLILTLFSGSLLAQDANPPLPGFNEKGSDPKAIQIADQVMEALGGRSNWEETAIIKWRFLGRRLHVWNKHTGDIRLEHKDLTVLMNLRSQEGRAWDGEEEISHPDSLAKTLDYANRLWINDSYWVFMPYKLKDSGVTLKFHGEQKASSGEMCDVLELTFKDVGVTPDNKYLVYVDQESHLVVQWDYFSKAEDPEPRISNPWGNWKNYGQILLSDNRGRGSHSEIAVFETLPESVMNNPADVDWKVVGASRSKKAD